MAFAYLLSLYILSGLLHSCITIHASTVNLCSTPVLPFGASKVQVLVFGVVIWCAAGRCKGKVAVDAFGGVGGNVIAMARSGFQQVLQSLTAVHCPECWQALS